MECNSRTIHESVLNTLQNNNIHLAIHNLNKMHSSVHTPNSTKIQGVLNNSNITVMNEAYLIFKSYCDKLTDGTEQSLTDNKLARKAVTHCMLKGESEKWHTTLQNKNSTELSSNIDWKGNWNNKIKVHPTLNELTLHFEHIYIYIYKYIYIYIYIYTCDDRLESAKIVVLSTDVYIPTLDDPIDSREFTDALKVCKKAGYDISLPIFGKIVLSFLPLICLIFNSIFYVSSEKENQL